MIINKKNICCIKEEIREKAEKSVLVEFYDYDNQLKDSISVELIKKIMINKEENWKDAYKAYKDKYLLEHTSVLKISMVNGEVLKFSFFNPNNLELCEEGIINSKEDFVYVKVN